MYCIDIVRLLSGKISNRILLPIYATTGNSRSGKTTLTAVLQKVLWDGTYFYGEMIKEVEELTAGIIPTHCEQ